MSLKTEYLAQITSEYANSTKFKATVDLLLDQFQQTYDGYIQMDTAFDIDTAVGVQLDVLGIIEGAGRSFTLPTGEVTLTDDEYRFLLKAVIARNHCKGVRESFLSVMVQLLGATFIIHLTQPYAMHLTLGLFMDVLTDVQKEIVKQYVPRPAGVEIDILTPPYEEQFLPYDVPYYPGLGQQIVDPTHKIMSLSREDGTYTNPAVEDGMDAGWFATKI